MDLRISPYWWAYSVTMSNNGGHLYIGYDLFVSILGNWLNDCWNLVAGS